MKSPWSYIRWFVLLLSAGMLLAACDESGFGERVDKLTNDQLASALKLAGFPADQQCKVEHSYSLEWPPPNNDFFFAYAIHVEPFSDSLIGTNPGGLSAWESGKDTDGLHLKILGAAQVQAASHIKATWLPPLEELSGAGYYRRFVIIDKKDNEPFSAEFFAYNRETHTLYYIGYKH